jgi:hypothetical protein
MMAETSTVEPTAATTRLDGGHPALELVNTIWGQVGGPVEHDVLATPEDLVTLASDAHTPVHRFAHAALELLTDEAELARLHQCQGCCWLFVDHSRGAGRRWCSMAYCGGDAKKRRYVEHRRERRRQLDPDRRDP